MLRLSKRTDRDYYLAGDDIVRLEASPHLEGFRARGVEVVLLADTVDNFWVASGHHLMASRSNR